MALTMRMLLLVVALSCRNGDKGETSDPRGDSADDSGSDSIPDSGDTSGDTGDDTALVDDTGDSGDDTGDSGDDTGGGDTTVPIDHDLESSAAMKLLGPDEYDTVGLEGLGVYMIAVGGAGDLSGDGYADLALGLPCADACNGQAYVVSRITAGTSSLSYADVVLTSTAGDKTGASVAGVGDVDSDGYDDMLIGAPSYDTYDGRAYLVSGPVSGAVDLESQATAIMQGIQGDDVWSMSYTGAAVGGAGDTNGDDRDDLLIGAPEYWDGWASSGWGRVYLLNGPVTGSLQLSTGSSAIVEAGSTARDLGVSLDTAGDFDGDGMSDFLVGTFNYGAYLFLGPLTGSVDAADASVCLANSDPDSNDGISVRGAGDVNGDGRADILVGANGPSADGVGRAYLVAGPITGPYDLDSSNAILVSEQAGDLFGVAVDGAGDANADGFDDIVVGAMGAWTSKTGYSAGTAYVVLGPVTGTVTMDHADHRLYGDGADQAGRSVAGVGDVDRDGLDDLLIGGPGDTDAGVDAGAAWLVLGSSL